MTILIGFIGIIVIALIGWAIAELKYKTITFTHSEEEAEEAELLESERRAEGFKEMNINDIMRKNSTKGFNAVG